MHSQLIKSCCYCFNLHEAPNFTRLSYTSFCRSAPQRTRKINGETYLTTSSHILSSRQFTLHSNRGCVAYFQKYSTEWYGKQGAKGIAFFVNTERVRLILVGTKPWPHRHEPESKNKTGDGNNGVEEIHNDVNSDNEYRNYDNKNEPDKFMENIFVKGGCGGAKRCGR